MRASQPVARDTHGLFERYPHGPNRAHGLRFVYPCGIRPFTMYFRHVSLGNRAGCARVQQGIGSGKRSHSRLDQPVRSVSNPKRNPSDTRAGRIGFHSHIPLGMGAGLLAGRIPLVKPRRMIYNLTSESQFQNLTSGQGQG